MRKEIHRLKGECKVGDETRKQLNRLGELAVKQASDENDRIRQIMEEQDFMIRMIAPPREYNVHSIRDVLEAIKAGNVIDDSIVVRVRDKSVDVGRAPFPGQEVTITFDFVNVRTDRGCEPFDWPLQMKGY